LFNADCVTAHYFAAFAYDAKHASPKP
jgi:hypothetical protein